MDDVITVHPDALRGFARDLADTSYRLGHGLHGTPGLTTPAAGWVAAAALAALESAINRYLGTVAGRVAETATGLRTAADEYEAVDERVARRFGARRRAGDPE
jgi:uncharacterized protein YukE